MREPLDATELIEPREILGRRDDRERPGLTGGRLPDSRAAGCGSSRRRVSGSRRSILVVASLKSAPTAKPNEQVGVGTTTAAFWADPGPTPARATKPRANDASPERQTHRATTQSELDSWFGGRLKNIPGARRQTGTATSSLPAGRRRPRDRRGPPSACDATEHAGRGDARSPPARLVRVPHQRRRAPSSAASSRASSAKMRSARRRGV